MNLYIVDLHFGHRNVIQFDHRPFLDAGEAVPVKAVCEPPVESIHNNMDTSILTIDYPS